MFLAKYSMRLYEFATGQASPVGSKKPKKEAIKQIEELMTENDQNDDFGVGDLVSWYYNKFHPRYAGKITRIDGDTYIVQALGDNQFYKLSKSHLNQYGKPDVNMYK
jgi:hypothetical protein